MRLSLIPALALGLVALAQPALSAPIPAEARNAAAHVETLGAEAIEALAQPRLSPSARSSRLRSVLDEGIGIATICREIVGEAWAAAGPAERRAFCGSFRDYLLGYLIAVLEEGALERFEVIGAEATASGDIKVATKVEREGLSVGAVAWIVRETGDGLEVIDVITDGVSLIGTYRAEFRAFVRRQGIEALTAALDRKAAAR